MFSKLLGNAIVADADKLRARLQGVLLPDEVISMGYQVIRDYFVFTDKRLILVDIQGITGSKVEYMTIPYKSIVRFAIETAGTFDLDAELKIWVSSTPAPIEKLLKKGTDTRGIQAALAMAICN